MLRLSLLLFTFSALAFDLVASSAQYCKPVPGGSRWPSIADWNTLNETVGGRLLAPTPPGAVCQPSSPLFNNESCAELVSTQWPSSDWHAKNPVTADYNDDTCLPSPLAPCSGNGYPEYVVNATRGSDVQAAVRFAKRTGVRLIVKGTGHDFPGRYDCILVMELDECANDSQFVGRQLTLYLDTLHPRHQDNERR